MRRIVHFIGIAVAGVLVHAAPTRAATIEGRVLDADGTTGRAGVLVTVSVKEPHWVTNVVSDAEGHVRADVPDDAPALRIRASSHETLLNPRDIELDPYDSSANTGFVFRVVPTASVEGQILDDDGTPVSHGTISAGPAGSDGHRVEMTWSRNDGYFRTLATPGVHLLRFDGMDEYYADPISINVTAGETARVDVVAHKGAHVNGRVVDADTGAPVERVFVRMKTEDDVGPMPTFTDVDGRFALAGLRPGDYVLRAEAMAGEAVCRTNITITGNGSIDGLTVSIRDWQRQLGAVEGRVTTARGEPVADFSIDHDFGEFEEGRPLPSGGTTDKEGRYRIEHLVPGAHLLRPGNRRPGWERAPSTTVVVNAGAVVSNVDFTVYGGRVSGRLLAGADREPVTGQFVMVAGENGSVSGLVKSDETGRYVVSNLPPGKLTVATLSMLDSATTGWPMAYLVDLGVDQIVDDLDFAPGNCAVRVAVAHDDGKPAAGALVYTHAILAPWRGHPGITRAGQGSMLLADAEGRLTISNLYEGCVGFTVAIRGRMLIWTNITVAAPCDKVVAAAFDGTGAIAGQAEYAGGRLLTGATVYAESVRNEPRLRVIGTTDTNGVYELNSIPSGTYRLLALADRSVMALLDSLEVRDGATSAAPALVVGRYSGALRGTTTLDGEPTPMIVTITTAGWQLPEATSDESNGTYLISGLPDGAYKVSIPSFISGVVLSNVTISGGATVEVDFAEMLDR